MPAGLYPDEIHLEGMTLSLDYRYDTGSPADGVTARIPIAALGQEHAGTSSSEWPVVPGYLSELIEELIRSLPKELRKTFIPIGDAARDADNPPLHSGEGSLYAGLALFLGKPCARRSHSTGFVQARILTPLPPA